VAVALLLVGCAAPKEKVEAEDPAALRAALEDVDRAFSEAFGRDDTLVVSSLYTDDAVLLPPNHEAVMGRDSITAFWAALLTPALKSLHLETTEVGGSRGDVYEMGRYTLIAGDGSTADRGKYLVLLKRQSDGGWRLFRDMWSSDLPAAAPKKK
jgi:ketosteroid isomerase-like protein